MKRLFCYTLILSLLLIPLTVQASEEKETFLVHLKTSLKKDDPLKKVSNKFFQPVTLKEMVKLRTEAKYYMAY